MILIRYITVHIMENYDVLTGANYSTEREKPYSLSDGKYKFNLISVNEDGLSQDTPGII